MSRTYVVAGETHSAVVAPTWTFAWALPAIIHIFFDFHTYVPHRAGGAFPAGNALFSETE